MLVLSWSTLLLWTFGGFIIAAFLDAKGIVNGTGFAATMIAVPVIGLARLFLYFWRSFHASNTRMSNPAYRQMLRQHGLA